MLSEDAEKIYSYLLLHKEKYLERWDRYNGMKIQEELYGSAYSALDELWRLNLIRFRWYRQFPTSVTGQEISDKNKMCVKILPLDPRDIVRKRQ